MSDVKVYIYDVSKGLARSLSMALIGKQLDGVWHTGVVVYGQEFYFGGMGGIEACSPGGTILGQPDKICDLGKTEIPFEVFFEYLQDLGSSTYRPDCYHLLDHNCNSFSSEISRFLTSKDIPSYVTNLPAEVMSTPFGQMVRPFVDSMSMQPSGGHSPFAAQASSGHSSNQTRDITSKPPAASTVKQNRSVETSEISEKEKPSFVIHKESIPDKTSFSELTPQIVSEQDITLLDDVIEYVAEENPSWSLGRDHLQLLDKIMCNKSVPEGSKLSVLYLLQRLLLNGDFIRLIQHDQKHTLQSVLQEFYSGTETIKMHIGRMVTNGLSSQMGRDVLTNQMSEGGFASLLHLSTDISTSCVLSKSQTLCVTGVEIVNNLSTQKLPDDTVVELASALLQCLKQELPEQCVYNCLNALDRFTAGNQEICELAVVMGTDLTRISTLSERVGKVTMRIQAKLS